MASGAVLSRYRQLYARADGALQQWDALHASAVGAANTCVNIILRLPALQDADSYGGSQLLLDAQHELLGKQMQSFERGMARLQELMAELDGVARAVAKLAADGARLLKEQRIALGSAVARQQLGATPSLADCVSGLQALRQALTDECRLHAALYAELRTGAAADDLQAAQLLLTDQPNIMHDQWRDISLRVSLTGEQG